MYIFGGLIKGPVIKYRAVGVGRWALKDYFVLCTICDSDDDGDDKASDVDGSGEEDFHYSDKEGLIEEFER